MCGSKTKLYDLPQQLLYTLIKFDVALHLQTDLSPTVFQVSIKLNIFQLYEFGALGIISLGSIFNTLRN